MIKYILNQKKVIYASKGSARFKLQLRAVFKTPNSAQFLPVQ